MCKEAASHIYTFTQLEVVQFHGWQQEPVFFPHYFEALIVWLQFRLLEKWLVLSVNKKNVPKSEISAE